MIGIDFKTGGHTWVALEDDLFQCSACQLVGLSNKGVDKTHLFFKRTTRKDHINSCNPDRGKLKYPKIIRIKNKKAPGIHYSNLIEGTQHSVIQQRKKNPEYDNGDIWVMGKYKPVRLMAEEYEVVEYITE